MRGHVDLQRTVAASIACAVLALILPWEALRLLAAAPLTLALPGYAVSALVFAGRPLTRPMLLVMTIAISLMTLVLSALLLNYFPGGIRAASWALLLVLVVAGTCWGAAVRRPPATVPRRRRSRSRPSRLDASLLAGGIAAASIAVALAFVTLPAKDALGYSELWVLPKHDPTGVAIGVASQEQDPTSYVLRVAFGKGRRPLFRSFRLEPGEETTVRVAPPGNSVGPLPVTASLFRQSRPDVPYRRVSGWLPPAESSR